MKKLLSNAWRNRLNLFAALKWVAFEKLGYGFISNGVTIDDRCIVGDKKSTLDGVVFI